MNFENKKFVAGGPDGTTVEDFTKEDFKTPSKKNVFYAETDGTIHTDKKIETAQDKERKIKAKLTELKGLKNFEEMKKNNKYYP